LRAAEALQGSDSGFKGGAQGASPDQDGNPVGLVDFAVSQRGRPSRDRKRMFPNLGRASIRHAAVAEAIHILTDVVTQARSA
jgi:nicotinamide mononucleotide (NMN) deamidase PncC